MEINFYPGDDISTAAKALTALKEQGIYASGKFNDAVLTTKMSEDEMYYAVVGKTKTQFERDRAEWRQEYQRREEEHKQAIPDLIVDWNVKGTSTLDERYWKLWVEMVPIRLGDLYHGMELGCTLEIVKILNNGGTLEEARKAIEDQGHSGMSFSLVCSMVRELCERGREFVEHVR